MRALYFTTMAARGRLITVANEQTVLALCTFFVLQDESDLLRYYCRPTWSTPLDSDDGALLYIDKLVCRGFTRILFRQIEVLLSEAVPSWQTAIWYRPGRNEDHRYTWSRKESLCLAP